MSSYGTGKKSCKELGCIDCDPDLPLDYFNNNEFGGISKCNIKGE